MKTRFVKYILMILFSVFLNVSKSQELINMEQVAKPLVEAVDDYMTQFNDYIPSHGYILISIDSVSNPLLFHDSLQNNQMKIDEVRQEIGPFIGDLVMVQRITGIIQQGIPSFYFLNGKTPILVYQEADSMIYTEKSIKHFNKKFLKSMREQENQDVGFGIKYGPFWRIVFDGNKLVHTQIEGYQSNFRNLINPINVKE